MTIQEAFANGDVSYLLGNAKEDAHFVSFHEKI
jgi:hypothetical protein